MLHPDPLQRATLSRVRKHPWAAPVVPAVYKAIDEPKDSSLLISEDPTKDLYEGALRKVRCQSSAVFLRMEQRPCVYVCLFVRWTARLLCTRSTRLATALQGSSRLLCPMSD